MKSQAPFPQTSHSGNEKGQSLVQVLISIGLMGILIMAFLSMTSYQQREMRALSEKLAASDLQGHLIGLLSDGKICSFQMQTTGAWTDTTLPAQFDVTKIGTSDPPTFSFKSILSAEQANAPLAAEVDKPASPITNTLVVKSIKITNVKGMPGMNRFLATFQVDFDPSKSVRAVKPAFVQIKLVTTNVGNTHTISKCLSPSSYDMFWQPVTTLVQYNSGCDGFPSPYSGSQLMTCNSACQRWCSSGCSPSIAGCAGTLPGLGYSGGTMTEYNSVTAGCACIP